MTQFPLVNNRYQSHTHVYSGSNGVTATVLPQVLPQHDNQSPVRNDTRIPYECPKFKLTQERALPLIRWYEEHQDHPYPSRQDKLRFCQSTQLTYTQVSAYLMLSLHSLHHACMLCPVKGAYNILCTCKCYIKYRTIIRRKVSSSNQQGLDFADFSTGYSGRHKTLSRLKPCWRTNLSHAYIRS